MKHADMNASYIRNLGIVISLMIVTILLSPATFADGDETLGPPSIPIASGSSFIAAGTGLDVQPGIIEIELPVGSTVQQALLYWHGYEDPDDTIIIEGNTVTGTQIGQTTPNVWKLNAAYRADITALDLVSQGLNSLSVEGLDFGFANNGAGLLLILDDGSTLSHLELRDGNDFSGGTSNAYIDPWLDTEAQTYSFAASSSDRVANLTMFFASVSGSISSGRFRPSVIVVEVDNVEIEFNNILDSLDGSEWDTVSLDISIPAGVTELTVQALSEDRENLGGLVASLVWVASGLKIPEPEPEFKLGDRVWEDRNADGIQDCVDGGAMDPMFPADGIVGNAGDSGTECDAGIAGVDVVLYENPDGDPACNNGGEVIVGTTFTDDFGFYVFDNLDPNKNYCVNFDRASAGVALLCNAIIGDATFSPEGAGSDTTIDSNADIASGRTGNIQSGDFNLSWDAGIYCPAKIGDRLVEDVNGDGIQNDLEPVGVGDQIVELLECENGVPGNVIRTTTTANNGMYMFNPLPPGEYAVRFTNPVDTVFIPMSPGNNDADNCDTDLNGETQCINLSANEYNDRVDACVYQPPSAGLGDFVFEDKNANGVQDGGEPGIVGVPVTLLTPGTNGACGTPGQVELFDTVTGLNGEYAFMNLAGGAYCVEFDKSAVTCDYGTAAYSPADATLDSDDSDVNPATNQTGVITLPDGVFDPTWDAGIYCPAKIGDTVWEDANGDGIQDDVPNTETGSQGVTVNLLDCTGTPVADLNGDSTLFTDGSGMYMFNVVPGDYIIEFVAPVDRIFTTENAAGSTDANDSDANAVSGRTSCITVPSNVFDDTWDAGLVLPPDCGIAVEKSCEIVQPAPGPFSCSGKVNRLTMIYDGSLGALINVTAHIGDTDQPTLPVQINGNEVTVSGYQAAGAPNDVVWVLSAANGSGESTFHLSCSDDEMDGETDDASFPNDCGRPEGDGKGNDAGVNLWLLEGMKTDEGEILDCTPVAPVSNSECVFQQQIASCASLPDKPDSIQFQYTGGGCSAENNGQDADKTDCIGSIDPNLAVTASFPGGTATVQPGGTFTIPRDGSVTMLTLSNSGGSETITFHTSCSQPLATGDVFFSLTLVGLAGNGLGTDVTYGYLIENTGLAAIDGIRVMDNKLGELATGLSLNPGASTTVTANAFISSTTTNTVTVTSDNNASCIAVDTATVTVLAPPPCSVSSNPKEIKDDAVKFELQNTGSAQSARLDTLTLNFPVEFGTIKEVKLDGTIYKSSDSPLVINSGDTINVGDWTEDNASKRDLDPGEERTLEIKFSNDYKDAEQSDFSGSATFEQGCSVSL